MLYGDKTWSGGRLDQVIADGANGWSIELRFVVGGDEWTVTRARKRSGAGVNKLECSTTGAKFDSEADVTRQVTALLGLDHTQFLRAVVMPQGRFDELLRAKPAERTKILSSVFGLADLAVVRKQAETLRAAWQGKVAVIGSAASAVQFVPEVAKAAGELTVYQRTANWVLPKDDTPFDDETLAELQANPISVRRRRWKLWRELNHFTQFDDTDLLSKAERAGVRNLAQVTDPEVRAKLTPTEPYGCKRPLISNDYFPTFNLPHVELVTDPIARVTATGVVTADGTTREADTIIVATGFQVQRYLSALDVTGRNGRDLRDAWSDGAQAYLGITTSGFPNLFMLYGPNTNQGSIIHMIECQVAYLVRQVSRLDDENLAWLDVKPEVQDAYNTALQAELDRFSVWKFDCNHYYRNESGRIVTQFPGDMADYRDRTARPDPDAYEVGTGQTGGGRVRPLVTR